MPTRSWSDPNSKYKYGFNGKEKDNEGNVDGGDYDFGARIYDSRLGRWLALDPKLKEYVSYSPYNYALNSPIINLDINGERVYFAPGLGYSPFTKSEPYVNGISTALTSGGIINKVIPGSFPNLNKKSGIMQRVPDMMFVVNFAHKPVISEHDDIRILNVVSSISADLIANPPGAGEQINLMGTSQGSVSIAQAAILMLENPEKYGLDKNFKIDNLVLVGSPIDKESELYKKLESLEKQGKIGKLLYDNYQSTETTTTENPNYTAPTDLVDEENQTQSSSYSQSRVNDNVTGLAGVSRIQAIVRGIGFLFSAIVKGNDHPHLAAANNYPTEPGNKTFGDQLTKKLKADGVQ